VDSGGCFLGPGGWIGQEMKITVYLNLMPKSSMEELSSALLHTPSQSVASLIKHKDKFIFLPSISQILWEVRKTFCTVDNSYAFSWRCVSDGTQGTLEYQNLLRVLLLIASKHMQAHPQGCIGERMFQMWGKFCKQFASQSPAKAYMNNVR
jgi:hypothetical protein